MKKTVREQGESDLKIKSKADQNRPVEIITNDIESQIALHEYLIREHYGQCGMSEEKLKKLKDSINYDSIVKNQKYLVFN